MVPPPNVFVIGAKGQKFDSAGDVLQREKDKLEDDIIALKKTKAPLLGKENTEDAVKKIDDEIKQKGDKIKEKEVALQSPGLDEIEELAELIKPLEVNDHYTEIRLGGNSYSRDSCKQIGELLRKQKKLKSIKLDDIFIGRLLSEIPTAIDYLLKPLLEVHTLQEIDLSYNAFGFNTKDPLVDFLKAHLPLRHLILVNNGLGPEAGAEVAMALVELGARKIQARTNPEIKYEIPHLETINCSRNRLEGGSMQAWAHAVKANGKGLRKITMSTNDIRADGIETLLLTGIRHAPDLEALDLRDNTPRSEDKDRDGVDALAEVVVELPSLRELGLTYWGLEMDGWKKVAEALAKGKNKKLEVLKLKGNEINELGVKIVGYLAKKGLPALRKIELDENPFDAEGGNFKALKGLMERRKERLGKDDDDNAWGFGELEELEEPESDDDSDWDWDAEAESVTGDEEADTAIDELGEKLKSATIQ
ncbi:hypothetical protein AJ79_09366 [Helicocarpus griseus UAMH5409]|uniref:Ran GTPase-activating protein 1 n=1 Tax=Helicocarpus griseus UAMH5409 TaxID=1447875 RepID=A0A2B7WK98_9EURO|nr:hypothetical protein AJ79_09366 [Helicocarpus griseus UAMH5409]